MDSLFNFLRADVIQFFFLIKKPHVFIFCFWCFQPIIVRANPVKGISDFDGGFIGVERITFECPSNNERNIQRTYDELDNQKSKEQCWVDFHPTYLNVMNKQMIYKKDIIRFWQSPPQSGKCCASWNLIYRDIEGNNRIISMRKKEFPFPLTKRKLKILGIPSNIINRWLAQE
tara:strand:+ start:1470 stop:1988 length:519 start_codon:yes stop_codon:yes gene_type:complete